MKTKISSNQNVFLSACILGLILSCTNASAQTKDDHYTGGPDTIGSVSETWHLYYIDSNPTALPAEHPYLGHGATSNARLALDGKKITLRRHGAKWFLIPGPALGWTPANISLADHPDWVPWGTNDQWRWLSNPPVDIEGHKHHICVGFPREAPMAGDPPTPRRDDDVIHIAFVDRTNPPTDPDCGDPNQTHPGHAGAGR